MLRILETAEDQKRLRHDLKAEGIDLDADPGAMLDAKETVKQAAAELFRFHDEHYELQRLSNYCDLLEAYGMAINGLADWDRYATRAKFSYEQCLMTWLDGVCLAAQRAQYNGGQA